MVWQLHEQTVLEQGSHCFLDGAVNDFYGHINQRPPMSQQVHGSWVFARKNLWKTSRSPTFTHSTLLPHIPKCPPVTVLILQVVWIHTEGHQPVVFGNTPGCKMEMVHREPIWSTCLVGNFAGELGGRLPIMPPSPPTAEYWCVKVQGQGNYMLCVPPLHSGRSLGWRVLHLEGGGGCCQSG